MSPRPTGWRRGPCRCRAPAPSESSPPSSSITRRRTATPWSRSTPATAPPCCSSWPARSTSRARSIHSAHVATYGERAVDVFYLTDLSGAKIEGAARLKALQARLLKAATPGAARRERRPERKGPRHRWRSPVLGFAFALEAEAAGDAVGPRLGEEGREDLPPARELRIDERSARSCPAWNGVLNATCA